MTESSDEDGRTTFADLMGDSKQLDVPTMEDLLGSCQKEASEETK